MATGAVAATLSGGDFLSLSRAALCWMAATLRPMAREIAEDEC